MGFSKTGKKGAGERTFTRDAPSGVAQVLRCVGRMPRHAPSLRAACAATVARLQAIVSERHGAALRLGNALE